MKAIVVEPNSEVRSYIEQFIKGTDDFSAVIVLQSGVELLRTVKNSPNTQYTVFVSWKLPDMSATALMQLISDYNASCSLVFLAGDEKSVLEAFESGVENILRIPFNTDRFRSCMDRIKKLTDSSENNEKPNIRINTFGYFDLYVNGNVVVFNNSRAKELFAMLVDSRGGVLTMERIIEMFWPDESYTVQHKTIYRKALYYLRNTLREYGAEDLLIFRRNQKALRTEGVQCDYFSFMEGDPDAMSTYNGSYMTDYSWAEITNGKLWRIKNARENASSRINLSRKQNSGIEYSERAVFNF